jgi:hypothetical protein
MSLDSPRPTLPLLQLPCERPGRILLLRLGCPLHRKGHGLSDA